MYFKESCCSFLLPYFSQLSIIVVKEHELSVQVVSNGGVLDLLKKLMRHTERETDRQTERETDRQRQRQGETETERI